MAYKFQHGQAILSGALDQEGSIDIKNDGSGEFELKHDGNTILSSTRALANVTTISGSEIISGRDLKLDVGGKIGISSDTDLMTLTANTVTVAGALATNAGTLSASARIDGFGLRIDTGGVIGTAGDNDLLTLNNGSLVVAGAGTFSAGNLAASAGSVSGSTGLAGRGLTIDAGGKIGVSNDTDLIELSANSVEIAGALSASTTLGGRSLTLDAGATIGASNDTDLLTLNNGSLLVTGQLTASVAMSASLVQCTTLEVGAESIKIGSATINETELASLDSVTAGTVAASKAVIVDSDKDISGFRNVTATGAFIIGSANLNEADMEQIDGITAGTVAASKAVVVDANKDASGFRNITAAGGVISGSGRVDAFGVRIDTGGIIGTAGDNDLLTLNNASLVVAGEIQPLTVSASARVDAFGLRVDTGGTIGTAGDTDLLTLNNGSLVVAGDLSGSGISGSYYRVDNGGTIGPIDDVDLLTLNSAQLVVGGALTASTRIDGRGLRIDTGGVIGTAGDNDLLTLNNASLVVAGAGTFSAGNLAASAGSVSGSAGLAGRGLTIDAGGKIGVSNDNDLMTLSANSVSVAGALATTAGTLSASARIDGFGLRIDTGGTIGTAGDNDLMTLANGALQIAGELSSSGEIDALAVNAHAFSINNEDVIDADSHITAANLSGSGTLKVAGTVRLDGVAAAVVDEDNDFFYILDANDSLVKKEAVGDVVTILAGDGLANSGNKFALDLNELGAAAVNVANDSIAIVDADDNSSKKESIADLVTAMAGTGLTATNGVLSTDAGAVTTIRTDGAVNTTALVEGYNFYTGSASKSLTLPASPTVGDVVVLKAGNLADGEKITVSRAGSHTIDGLTSVELESDYAAASFVYLVADNWGIV